MMDLVKKARIFFLEDFKFPVYVNFFMKASAVQLLQLRTKRQAQ